VLHALPGEQHRSGEAGATAADDQNWDVFVAHLSPQKPLVLLKRTLHNWF
jgi:hypothetical protein